MSDTTKQPAVKQPRIDQLQPSGLQMYDLSQPWGHGVPEWPSSVNLATSTLKFHAKDGYLLKAWEGIMHRTTHMDVEIHVTENGKSLKDYPLSCYFGTGVVVSIPKGKWGVITAEDLEKATPTIRRGDIVMINTGSHHNLGDNDDYYQYSPGFYKEAGEWLVERGVKLVGIDVQALDHPLGTKLVSHGPGPTHPHLFDEYRAETGREIGDDFPYWEPCHKIITGAGIPGIENIGGQLDAVTGKRCTFMCFPWNWPDGDGCVIRVVAMTDADQSFRFATGA